MILLLAGCQGGGSPLVCGLPRCHHGPVDRAHPSPPKGPRCRPAYLQGGEQLMYAAALHVAPSLSLTNHPLQTTTPGYYVPPSRRVDLPAEFGSRGAEVEEAAEQQRGLSVEEDWGRSGEVAGAAIKANRSRTSADVLADRAVAPVPFVVPAADSLDIRRGPWTDIPNRRLSMPTISGNSPRSDAFGKWLTNAARRVGTD